VTEFLQRAEMEIHRRGLFSRGQKILVAVSGGADSMVLLHVLNSLAGKNRWKISVAHFNHQLRGRASDADEKLVRQIAKKLKLPSFVERADVKKFAAQSKISIELAARKLRHDFFARLAREQKIPVIALAHHANDQVELFFLRLLRGTGGEGLAGMKWISPSPASGLFIGGRAKLPLCPFVAGDEPSDCVKDFKNGAERQLRPTSEKILLVRPLLGFSKKEILEFARANKISFRDDATNFSNDFLRNRIRNELIPLLQKKYQPGLAKSVLRLMEIVGAEAELVGAAARQWNEESRIQNPESRMTVGDFGSLPPAIQRKVLQRQLIEAGVAADFELVESLRQSAGKFVSVGAEFSVARDAGGKVKLRQEVPVENFKADELKLKLSGRTGRAEFGGKEFCWSKKTHNGSRGRSLHQNQIEFFDADKTGGEIVLRHWRAGDRFQPIGLKSAAKLQDLFVNAKIPAARRRSLVLAVTLAAGIFWVEGLRIGEQFKLTPETRRQLVWNWSNLLA
jgi:tRNA(Ile)-lysidine synthase